MNKILLTGASGFLGEILQASLLADNYAVVGMGRHGQPLSIDITEPFQLPFQTEIDTVIHAAGKAHSVPKTAEEEKEFYDVNYQGTVNLCKAIDHLEIKPKAFIFISTVAVYGVEEGEMIAESHPLNGITPYAKSKIEAERYLLEWSAKNHIVLSILRLPLIAGFNPPGNLGAMIHGIKTGKYLSIGKANAKKSMIWAEDIVPIIPQLAAQGGIYNLTDGYHPTFAELEVEISRTLGKPLPIKVSLFLARLIAKVGDLLGSKAPINTQKLNKITASLTFDDQYARRKLGWKPSNTLSKISKIV